MIVWLIIGCLSTESPPTDSVLIPPDESGPYLIDEEDELPVIDFEALEAHLGAALTAARQFSADPFLSVYEDALSDAVEDMTCPRWFQNDEATYWSDACTTESGAEFSGFGVELYEAVEFVDQEGNMWSNRAAWGSGLVSTSDGRGVVLNGGSLNVAEGLSENGAMLFSQHMHQGVQLLDATDSWLESSPSFNAIAWSHPEWGVFLQLAGSYQTDLGHLLLQRLHYMSSPFASCSSEPYGQMAFYMQDVGWLDMSMDGSPIDDPQIETPHCDGCLKVSLKGVMLGEVCPDFSGLLDWQVSPWE